MESVATAECPVSLITADSLDWVATYHRSKRLGVPLYGQDLSAWPAVAVDAIETLEMESIRYENARMEAERR